MYSPWTWKQTLKWQKCLSYSLTRRQAVISCKRRKRKIPLPCARAAGFMIQIVSGLRLNSSTNRWYSDWVCREIQYKKGTKKHAYLQEEHKSSERNHIWALPNGPVLVRLVFEIVSNFSPLNLCVWARKISRITTTFLRSFSKLLRNDFGSDWYAYVLRNNLDRRDLSSNLHHTTVSGTKESNQMKIQTITHIKIPIFLAATSTTTNEIFTEE